MRTIGLMPVRNEALCLPHSLAAMSQYCDVIVVSDQNSDDQTRQVCRSFEKVILLEHDHNAGDKARWELLDVARNYEGPNLLWFCDADELISPSAFQRFFAAESSQVCEGMVVACFNHDLWGSPRRFRYDADSAFFRPGFKPVGFVDDRISDYDRTDGLSLHRERFPAPKDAVVLKREDLPLLHLQWLFGNNQLKQAWYRCQEWIEGRKPAAEINRYYSVTLPPRFVHTEPVPDEWVADLSFPDFASETMSWQEREMLAAFNRYGLEYFEPLEIWHIDTLRRQFVRSLNRQPKPDRSYRQGMWRRLRQHAGRVVDFGNFARTRHP
jgi:glycosyltransferase involved in cell wall biosynthesis